jgi:TonB-linked SusC/RagA family outer membrane protein
MKHCLTIVLGLLLAGVGLAQGKTVTGKVTDDTGAAFPGVTVQIKGTDKGTTTDDDGKYKIDVPGEDATLVFSFTGMAEQEKPVKGVTSIDIALAEGEVLDELVVTALGIKRDEKSVGYAISKVDGDAIRNSNQTNVINSLSGVVAGANVTQSSGSAGGSSRVVLRGFTSLTGDNQALIVIDGIKINNSELNDSRTEGVAQSNRAIDINPDDIESVSVLKGGAATALYGIDGANGVILITTKKGQSTPKGQFNVSAGTSIGFSQVNRLPKLQNTYSQGTAWYSADGQTPEYYAPETGWLTSWGPNVSDLSWNGESNYDYDQNGNIVLSSDPTAQAQVTPYDNMNNFFRTGVNTRNNISISGGDKTSNFRFSLSDTRERGIVPNNSFAKTNVGLVSGLSLLDNKLNITTSASYINSGGRRIQQGSNLSGVMLGLLRTPITFDNADGNDDPLNTSSAYEFADGSQRNFRGGGGYDNPWWTVNKNPFRDNVNRLIGSLQASYEFSPMLTVMANVGVDTYGDRRQQIFAIGSRSYPTGQVVEENYNVAQMDAYLTASGQTTFGNNDNFDFTYQAGINSFTFKNNRLRTEGNGFGYMGFENLSNASTINSLRQLNERRSFSLFASTDIGYKRFLYLTVTGRQDYDSRFMVPGKEFKAGDIGFFYPSVSTSFIFSELTESKNLSFGKLRLSWARIARGPSSSYITNTTYAPANGIGDGWTNGIAFPYLGQTGYLLSNTAGSSALSPETSDEFEVGTQMIFFKRRLSVDVAYYNRKTRDAILPAAVSASTGYSSIFLNSGKLTTNGIDLAISAKPVVNTNFEWTIGANFTKYKTMVNELYDGLEQLFVGGFTGTGIYHIPGQEFGQIYGGAWLRDQSGNLIIDDQPGAGYGYPIADPNLKVIGNPNPDFILGITNTVRVKNFSVSFLFDMNVGGQMWNGTQGALTFFGMSELTEGRDQPGETGSHVFEGVQGHLDTDGNVVTSGATNSATVAMNEDWYTGNGGGFGSVAEHFIQDASTYRLRNLTVSYNIPSAKLKNGRLSEVRFFLTGNNLLLITPYEGIDPETSLLGGASNAQGFDYFNMPNTRSLTFGINVKL